LNAELGLSHETITQRCGTKRELFRAAIAHGVRQFVDEYDAEVEAARPTSDLERLRATVRAFIIAASHHPNLGELLHQGGLSEQDRAELTGTIGLDARLLATAGLLQRLHTDGAIRDVSMRELWFLMQAGAAPLHFQDLAAMFDPLDGPLDADRHIDRMVELVIGALRNGN
jgi:AcrR family transcriptional regulator